MATITVKNIPDDLYERLKATAVANRRSINSEIIICIERAMISQPIDSQQILARAREARTFTAKHIAQQHELEEAIKTGRP